MFSKTQQANRKPKAKKAKKPRKPLKRGKPVKRQSAKKRLVFLDRQKLRKFLILARGDICELKFHPQCINKAQGLHEPLKQSAKPWRVGDYERGRRVLLACNICNGHVENEPAKAMAAGLSVSRYNRKTKND